MTVVRPLERMEDVDLHNASIIADLGAMVRRATFYKHFQDKYDFFAFFIRRVQEELEENIQDYKDENPKAYYLYVFQECLEYLQNHRALVDCVLESNMFPTLLDILSEEIEKRVLEKMQEDSKILGIDIPAKLLATFYTGGIVKILRYWLTTPAAMSEEELVDQMRRILEAYQIM